MCKPSIVIFLGGGVVLAVLNLHTKPSKSEMLLGQVKLEGNIHNSRNRLELFKYS